MPSSHPQSVVHDVPATTRSPDEYSESELSAGSVRPDLDDSADISQGIGPGKFPGIRSPLRSLWWLVQIIIGLVFLVVLLALLAAVPGLSLLSLGYLLAAEAGLAKSGRLRDAFPLLAVSTRTGMILAMTGLFLLPIWLLSSLAASHGVIAQSSPVAPNLQRTILIVLQVLVFTHLCAAIACGGSQSCFIRPIRNVRRLLAGWRDGSWTRSVNRWSEWLVGVFRPWEHIWLAIKAVVGAFIWLVIPTAMLSAVIQPTENPGLPGTISVIGAIVLIPVASWLPLLQVHQAVTGRFSAIFEVKAVRRIIRSVPLHWAFSTTLLYAAAIPLYLTKVRLLTDDAMWLITPLFVILIYPTRLMFGWVYARGINQPVPVTGWIRRPVKLLMIPVLLFYAGILHITPFISEAGRAAIFENHAFLLPIPGKLFGS